MTWRNAVQARGGILAGQAAIGACGAAPFLAERYRRLARRHGKAIAQAAVAAPS